MATPKYQIVSANDLLEGDVVYLERDGVWTRSIKDALIAEDDITAQALLNHAKGQINKIVDPYLLDVAPIAGVPMPRHYREKLRDRGPSVRPDLQRNAA